MITLENITLRRGTSVLLEQVNWVIYQRERIGLIGPNGSGKSSLFAMLLGELEPDIGDLEFPKQLKIAHVAQETPGLAQTALDFVLDGDDEYRQVQAALTQAESSQDGEEIAVLHEQLAAIDGYTTKSRAAQLLAGLGFTHHEQQQLVSSFSGGYRVRLNLAKALMCRSDVLLLDEPTNHLDLDAVLWLEQWLATYPGTLILISHDRDFLDKTVNHIAHLDHQRLKIYSGNYSLFEKERVQALLIQQAAYEKQQKHIAHMQAFVNRFRAKASKARQAQSRLKAIERMDLVCAVQSESPFQFEFRSPTDCPYPLITLEQATIAYGEKTVLKNINISLAPKERIAILGPNGAGKSSLIKLLAGDIEAAQGIRYASPGLKIGYFAQHQVDHLRLDESPLEHIRDLANTTSELELRKFLGGFGFSGDTVFAPILHFSGGEKSRLALALLVWQRPNLLLLDEPTNHLDLEMRQALSIALQEYEGAMVLVSHDRFLVRTTTDNLLLAADGNVSPFEGDVDDYQTWLIQYRKQHALDATQDDKGQVSRKTQRQQDAKQREALRPLLQKINQLEKELDKLQNEFADIQITLADPTIYEANNKATLQKQLLAEANVKTQLVQVEENWLQACDERDQLQK